MRWVRGNNEFKKPLGCFASRVIEEEERDEGYGQFCRRHENPYLDNGAGRSYGTGRRYWDRYSQCANDRPYNDYIDTRSGESSTTNRGQDDSGAQKRRDDYEKWDNEKLREHYDWACERLRESNRNRSNDRSGATLNRGEDDSRARRREEYFGSVANPNRGEDDSRSRRREEYYGSVANPNRGQDDSRALRYEKWYDEKLREHYDWAYDRLRESNRNRSNERNSRARRQEQYDKWYNEKLREHYNWARDRLRESNRNRSGDANGAKPHCDTTYRLYGDTTTNDFNKYNKFSVYDDGFPGPKCDTSYRLYGDTTANDFNKYNKHRLYDDSTMAIKGKGVGKIDDSAYLNGPNNDDCRTAYQGRVWFATKAFSDDERSGDGYRFHCNKDNKDDSGSRLNDNCKDSYNSRGNYKDDNRRSYGYGVDQPKAVIVKRAIVPDNSCLFNAIGYAICHRRDQAQALRRAVVKIVAEDPKIFNEAILGMPNVEYCRWICNPASWGGGIELEILGDMFHCEIATYDVFTGKPILHAEGKGHKQRILLLYDGKHYDTLALAQNIKAPEIIDQTIFPIGKDHTLGDVEPLIEKYFKERNILAINVE